MTVTTKFEILYNEGSDSVVIADTTTRDDIAEVFHNERHTVTQTVEQALRTARLFAAAPELYGRLVAERDNRDAILKLLLAGDVDCVVQKLLNGSKLTDETLAKARGESVA